MRIKQIERGNFQINITQKPNSQIDFDCSTIKVKDDLENEKASWFVSRAGNHGKTVPKAILSFHVRKTMNPGTEEKSFSTVRGYIVGFMHYTS